MSGPWSLITTCISASNGLVIPFPNHGSGTSPTGKNTANDIPWSSPSRILSPGDFCMVSICVYKYICAVIRGTFTVFWIIENDYPRSVDMPFFQLLGAEVYSDTFFCNK
jgi:hypothetical protein